MTILQKAEESYSSSSDAMASIRAFLAPFLEVESASDVGLSEGSPCS